MIALGVVGLIFGVFLSIFVILTFIDLTDGSPYAMPWTRRLVRWWRGRGGKSDLFGVIEEYIKSDPENWTRRESYLSYRDGEIKIKRGEYFWKISRPYEKCCNRKETRLMDKYSVELFRAELANTAYEEEVE